MELSSCVAGVSILPSEIHPGYVCGVSTRSVHSQLLHFPQFDYGLHVIVSNLSHSGSAGVVQQGAAVGPPSGDPSSTAFIIIDTCMSHVPRMTYLSWQLWRGCTCKQTVGLVSLHVPRCMPTVMFFRWLKLLLLALRPATALALVYPRNLESLGCQSAIHFSVQNWLFARLTLRCGRTSLRKPFLLPA